MVYMIRMKNYNPCIVPLFYFVKKFTILGGGRFKKKKKKELFVIHSIKH